jgi:hypothetical protein
MTTREGQVAHGGSGSAGARIVTKEPAPRSVTSEVVKHLRDGGASKDLVDFAERHSINIDRQTRRTP